MYPKYWQGACFQFPMPMQLVESLSPFHQDLCLMIAFSINFLFHRLSEKKNKLVNVLKRKVFNNYEIFRQFSSHYYLKKRNDFHSMYLIEFYQDFKFPILKLNILKSHDLQIMIQSSIPNIYDGAFCENS